MFVLAAAPLFVFPALMIIAALKDFTTMLIPNWISIVLAAAFVVIAPFHLPLEVFGLHLGVGAAALTLTFTMFALNWIGGGDAKLFAATALWVGWGDPAVMYVYATALAGGALALAAIMVRHFPLVPARALAISWVAKFHEHKGPIPYGVALAIGGLAAFPMTPLYLNVFGAASPLTLP